MIGDVAPEMFLLYDFIEAVAKVSGREITIPGPFLFAMVQDGFHGFVRWQVLVMASGNQW